MRRPRDLPESYRRHLAAAAHPPASALTPRSLALGLWLAAAMGAAGPYIALYMQGSNPGGLYYINPLAHFLFLVLVGIVNTALAARRPAWALQRGELITVYILMILANSTFSLVFYFVPILSGAFYYATPENQFQLLHPHIPEWIAPRDIEALTALYEGAGAVESTDLWKAWATPLLCWLPLLAAVQTGTLSLMVLLRRQWSQHEHLPYPLIQVPLAMVEDGERPVKPFFRRAPVWLGFAAPVAVLGFQGLHAYFPGLSRIALSRSFPVFGGASLQLFIHFGAIGFFYLVNREIAFSLWVFSLLNTLQVGVFNISGWGGKMPAVSDWTYTHHHIAHQSVGAMVVLVLGGLWMARGHLGQVVRKAFTPAPEIDDSEEIISYRGALFALAASAAVIAGWLFLAGIPPLAIGLFLFLVFVIFVSLTRLCAEGGVATLFPPMVAPDVTVSMLGSGPLGASGMTGLLFSRVWANDILNFSMPHCANGLKLGEQLGRKRGRMFAAMLAAALLAAAAGTFSLLEICHAYGGLNLSRHFTWLPQAVCDYAVSLIQRPSAPETGGWMHTGIGGLVMGALMAARWRYPWWPLHPLGFPVCSVFGKLTINAFIAWGMQTLVKRFGGQRSHLTARSFFMGMILGHTAVYGIFWIVDALAGVTGNRLQ